MSQSQIGSFFSVQKRKAGHEVTKAGKEVGSGVEKMKGSAKNREFDLTTSAGLKRKLDSLKCDKKVAASSSKAVIKDLSGSKPREEEKRKEKGGAPSSSSLSPPCEKRAKLSSVNARLLEAIQAGEKRKQQQLKKKDKAKEELEQKPVDKEVVPCSPKLSKSDFVLSLSVPQSPVKKVSGIPPSPTKPKV